MAGSVWPQLDTTLGVDNMSSQVDKWNAWQAST